MVKVKIKDLAPGAFFDIGPVKVKVMEHFADGKTLLTATEPIGNRPFTVRPFTYKRQAPEPNPNDFRFSTLKDDLNTDFLAAVAAGGVIPVDRILDAAWDLTASDGVNRYGYVTCKVAMLPEALVRKYYDAGLLEIDDWEWTITPYAGYADYARSVNTGGGLGSNSAWYGLGGVRPALFLAPDTLVSDTTDTDGAYIIQWNQPPTTPSSISHATPQAGKSLTITTGGSTDPEGNAIKYVWERRVDSGNYVQIGITTAKSITDTVPTSGTNYQVRVKAVDANGAESAYKTGTATAISYNTAPVISGSNQNVGAKTAPLTYKYTVTDAEASSQTLTVTETLTNGSKTITLRQYRTTSGAQNTADLTSVWLRLLGGTHVLKITASDGAGGTATRQITFSRTVTRIAASRAISTDAMVTKVFLSLYPADIPADAVLHCEVTNNPFDTTPVWEDISSKVGRFVHIFQNTTAAKGYGLAYRFTITKGGQTVEVVQATVRFA